jgi:ribosomal subunit interface protein
MRIPLQITFKNLDPSPALEEVVREKAAVLERSCDRITSCRVVVEAPHRGKGVARRFHVSVDLTLPGTEIAASSGPDISHNDMRAAVRAAFEAAQRRLDAFLARRDERRQEERSRALGPALSGAAG